MTQNEDILVSTKRITISSGMLQFDSIFNVGVGENKSSLNIVHFQNSYLSSFIQDIELHWRLLILIVSCPGN